MSIGHISFLDSCKQTWGQKAELEGNLKPDQLTGKIVWGARLAKWVFLRRPEAMHDSIKDLTNPELSTCTRWTL